MFQPSQKMSNIFYIFIMRLVAKYVEWNIQEQFSCEYLIKNEGSSNKQILTDKQNDNFHFHFNFMKWIRNNWEKRLLTSFIISFPKTFSWLLNSKRQGVRERCRKKCILSQEQIFALINGLKCKPFKLSDDNCLLFWSLT